MLGGLYGGGLDGGGLLGGLYGGVQYFVPVACWLDAGLVPDGVPVQPAGVVVTVRVWVNVVPEQRVVLAGIQVPGVQPVQGGGGGVPGGQTFVPGTVRLVAGAGPGGLPVQATGSVVMTRVWSTSVPAHTVTASGVQFSSRQDVQGVPGGGGGVPGGGIGGGVGPPGVRGKLASGFPGS